VRPERMPGALEGEWGAGAIESQFPVSEMSGSEGSAACFEENRVFLSSCREFALG
jgi:hypothetical protein